MRPQEDAAGNPSEMLSKGEQGVGVDRIKVDYRLCTCMELPKNNERTFGKCGQAALPLNLSKFPTHVTDACLLRPR